MNLKNYPDVLTINDLIDILKISKNTAYQMIKNKVIKSHKIGRIYRIPKSCLYDYLQSARFNY